MVFSQAARSDMISVVAFADTTIYGDVQGNSNALGDFIFAGVKGVNGGFGVSRALMAFDLSGLPSGAMVTSVSLRLFLDRAPPTGATDNFFLHTVETSWGEGTSDAAGMEAGGAPATTGDATWIHNDFNSLTWGSAGGDFSAAASATQGIGTVLGFHTIESMQMISDAQMWVDTPSANFGWALLGDEGSFQNARRFASNEDSDFGPTLSVGFSVPEPRTVVLFLFSLLVVVGREKR